MSSCVERQRGEYSLPRLRHCVFGWPKVEPKSSKMEQVEPLARVSGF